MMSGVASGYYIFEPVVRSAAAQQKAELREIEEISDLAREPFEDVKAQHVAASCSRSPFSFSSWWGTHQQGRKQT